MENYRNRQNRLKILTASGSALILLTLVFIGAASMSWNDGEDGSLLAVRDQTVSSSQTIDPVASFRQERRQVRDEEIRQLNGVIDDANTSADIRASAQRQLLSICEWMEKEATLEGILRARGYSDALATVHTDSVNILLRSQEITQADAAIILDLVTRETGQSGGNIKIIPIN